VESVFNAALLARLRRQTEEPSLAPDRAESFEVKVATDCDTLNRGTGAHRNYDQNTDSADEPDRIPVTDDPNDIDPYDLTTTVMRQSNDLLSPPKMPCSWWIRMTLDPPDTPVSVEDARLCVALVSAHLRQASQEALSARLMSRQGGDSGGNGSHDGRRDSDSRAFPSTVGALHEAIEALGPNAWRMFTRLWEIACEIPAPPTNRPGAPLHEASPPADSSLNHSPEALRALPASPRPDAAQLEPGLQNALPGMPDRVAGFLRYQPRDPPAWVYQESASERAERQGLEDIGGWVGG
jgi:hypothetical protein